MEWVPKYFKVLSTFSNMVSNNVWQSIVQYTQKKVFLIRFLRCYIVDRNLGTVIERRQCKYANEFDPLHISLSLSLSKSLTLSLTLSLSLSLSLSLFLSIIKNAQTA
jgi:hypothetical protein